MEIYTDQYGTIYNAPCLSVLRGKPENSFDFMVTDPPYAIELVGRSWDKALPSVDVWKECFRVLKPGSFAFIMSSPRQDVLSRMITNLQDAGFRTDFTSIYWAYLDGMGKAVSIKSMANGYKYKLGDDERQQIEGKLDGAYASFLPKPALEAIIVAMKPLEKSNHVSQALENGKGVTWLDHCKIPFGDGDFRMPSNLLVSDNALEQQSEHFDIDRWFGERIKALPEITQRQFPLIFVEKPSVQEKNKGLSTHASGGVTFNNKRCMKCGKFERQAASSAKYMCKCESPEWLTISGNTHPTVKPLRLFAYLVELCSKPGDIGIDIYAGSGTFGIACKMLGRTYCIVEKEREFTQIAVQRINAFEPVEPDEIERLMKDAENFKKEAAKSAKYVFLLPTRTKEMDATIRGDVPWELIEKHFGQETTALIQKSLGNQPAKCWGFKGMVGGTLFGKMKPGDTVLMREKGTGKINYMGTVAFKVQSESFPAELWEDYAGANMIFFLKDVKEINVNFEDFNIKAGYSPNYKLQGPISIRENSLVGEHSEYASIGELMASLEIEKPSEPLDDVLIQPTLL